MDNNENYVPYHMRTKKVDNRLKALMGNHNPVTRYYIYKSKGIPLQRRKLPLEFQDMRHEDILKHKNIKGYTLDPQSYLK